MTVKTGIYLFSRRDPTLAAWSCNSISLLGVPLLKLSVEEQISVIYSPHQMRCDFHYFAWMLENERNYLIGLWCWFSVFWAKNDLKDGMGLQPAIMDALFSDKKVSSSDCEEENEKYFSLISWFSTQILTDILIWNTSSVAEPASRQKLGEDNGHSLKVVHLWSVLTGALVDGEEFIFYLLTRW